MEAQTTKNGFAIVPRTTTLDGYTGLRAKTTLSPFPAKAAEAGMRGPVFAVVAKIGGRVVGTGQLIGDAGCFFQVVDIAIAPPYQGHAIHKAIMASLMDHVNTRLPAGAYVSLVADVPASRLYESPGLRDTAPLSVGVSYRRD